MKSILAPLAFAVALAAAAPAAWADKRSEAYVESNANEVLKVLNDRSLSGEKRSETFSTFMHEFAHVPTIARRVLGAHGRGLSEAEFKKYYDAFEAYAIAVYQYRLDQFRGETIRVVGSTDLDPRRSQVKTLLKSSETGQDMEVVWDVLMSQDGKSYRVRDVGLNLQGSLYWLAQEQQIEFEEFLNRNRGDVSKLVTRINQMTADLESRRLPASPKFGARPGAGDRG